MAVRTAQDAASLTRAQGVPGAEQTFPKGFMWGVATAEYQNSGDDGTSNWSEFEREGHVAEKSGIAADGYRRYAEDLDLAKGMGLNSYRMSLEWSRIEPRRGVFDPDAISHYHAVIDAAIARGLTPVVTLSHFTYPAWLDHPLSGGPGGWESPETVIEFRDFAFWAAQEYGSKVRYWLTLNEPNGEALTGYLVGVFAPGKRNPLAYSRVLDHFNQAHRAAYGAIKSVYPGAMVSFNPFVFKYQKGAAARAESLNPNQNAMLDAAMGYGQASASCTLDYVAFDYYYALNTGNFYDVLHDWDWPVYPQGLYETCQDLYHRYHLPLMIAENGLATRSDHTRSDGWTASAYVVNHLAQLRRAMAEGVPVLGYMLWSLTDNYEWGSFEPRFGLFTIDRKDPSLTRLRTEAADTYQAIATHDGLTPALLERYLGKSH